MDKDTLPTPEVPGDFAARQRTDSEAPKEALNQGDFAAGQETKPETPAVNHEEALLQGDFAAGERTEPLTPENTTPGTFADTDG